MSVCGKRKICLLFLKSYYPLTFKYKKNSKSQVDYQESVQISYAF